MLHNYETLMLARSEITNDELSMIEKHFDKYLSDAKGNVTAFDKWGKYRLAYQVVKNDYGVYVLARYQVPVDKLTHMLGELNTFLKIKCNEIVLRHVTKKLANASTSYNKPDAIDSARSGGLDTFLKENKMETLLNTGDNNSDEDSE
jgi:ribosomal protein S6